MSEIKANYVITKCYILHLNIKYTQTGKNYEMIQYYLLYLNVKGTQMAKLCNDKMVSIRRNVCDEVNIFK